MNRRTYVTRSPLPRVPEAGVTAPSSQSARESESMRRAFTGKDAPAYINLNARTADEFFIFSAGFTVDGEGNASFAGGGTFGGELIAAFGTFDVITGGRLDNATSNPTAGMRLDTSVSKPGTWVRYIDLAATGTQEFIQHPALTLLANGGASFSGGLVAATGTFAGSLSAATGTFSGALSAATGTFSGNVTSSATISAVEFNSSVASFTNVCSAASFRGYVSVGVATNARITFGGTSISLIAGGLGLVTVDNDFQIGGNVGFYGTAAGAKPTVTGSRGGNAALASLLTALSNLGLVTDSST